MRAKSAVKTVRFQPSHLVSVHYLIRKVRLCRQDSTAYMTELYWRMVYIKLSTNGYTVLTKRGNQKLKFKAAFCPIIYFALNPIFIEFAVQQQRFLSSFSFASHHPDRSIATSIQAATDRSFCTG